MNAAPAVRRLVTIAAVAVVVGATVFGAGSPPLAQTPALQTAGDISPQALAQINALLQEKSSWTPAQRKIKVNTAETATLRRSATIAM